MSGESTPRSGALDVLRVLAIAAVLAYHLGLHASWQVMRHGWMGVDLFFVLSGLLIGGQLFTELSRTRSLALGPFYARRAWRILPSYLVVVAIYACLPQLRENPEMGPLWKYLTFTQNFGLRIDHTGAFIHAWSLCVEEHFYLVLPVLALLFRNRGQCVSMGLIAGLLVFACAVRFGLWEWLAPARDTEVFPYVSNEYLYYPTFSHFDGLIYGVALALVRVYRPSWWTSLRRYPLVALVISVAAFIAAGICDDIETAAATTFQLELVSIGCAALVVASMSDPGERLLSKLPFASAGATLAFAVYLTHQLVFHACEVLLSEPYGVLGVMLTLAFCVLAAAALHVVVELPGLRLRRRRSVSAVEPIESASVAQPS